MKIPSPIEQQLLSLLSARERTGREIAQLFKQETGKDISYGTLYTAFRRLKEGGLVTVRDDEDEDGRVRFFKLTGTGQLALKEGREYYAKLSTFGRFGPEVNPA